MYIKLLDSESELSVPSARQIPPPFFVSEYKMINKAAARVIRTSRPTKSLKIPGCYAAGFSPLNVSYDVFVTTYTMGPCYLFSFYDLFKRANPSSLLLSKTPK